MIPIRDRNPTHSWPIVTVLLIIGNIYVFVKHNMSMNQHQLATMFSTYGAVPKQILSPENIDHLKVGIVSLFTSMFLHGGILHVGGNMLYLWIFERDGESRLFPRGGQLQHLVAAHCHASSVQDRPQARRTSCP